MIHWQTTDMSGCVLGSGSECNAFAAIVFRQATSPIQGHESQYYY